MSPFTGVPQPSLERNSHFSRCTIYGHRDPMTVWFLLASRDLLFNCTPALPFCFRRASESFIFSSNFACGMGPRARNHCKTLPVMNPVQSDCKFSADYTFCSRHPWPISVLTCHLLKILHGFSKLHGTRFQWIHGSEQFTVLSSSLQLMQKGMSLMSLELQFGKFEIGTGH